MDYGPWNNFRFADPEWAVGNLFETNTERCPAKARYRVEQGFEQPSSAERADDRECRSFSPLVLREDHRVEKEGDEVRKVICVKMGEQ